MTTRAITIARSPASAAEPGLRERAVSNVRDCLPVVASAAACLLLILLLRFNPLPEYWRIVFRSMGGYLWWPIPFVACALTFPLLGWWKHRRTGKPTSHGLLAAWATAAFVVTFVMLITAWVADRDRLWCLGLWSLCVTAAAATALGKVSYDESWRKKHTASVAARVRAALLDGSFRLYVAGRYHRRLTRPHWGSRHCLALVETYYRERKVQLLAQVGAGREVTAEHVSECLNAGWALVEYLDLRWAATLPEAEDWQYVRAEVIRETLTLWLWMARLDPSVQRVDAQTVDRHLDNMRRGLPAACAPYVAFLATVFHFSIDAGSSEAAVPEIMRLYEDLQHVTFDVRGHTIVAREVARDSWLTLAPGVVDDQLVIDVWLALHRPEEDLMRLRVGRDDVDPAVIGAQVQREALYRRWSGRIPEPWRDAMSERAREARHPVLANAPTPARVWAAGINAAARISSWPYWWVWRAGAVQRRLISRTVAFAAPSLVALLAAAPVMHGNAGWNVIDAIDEYNPLFDYRDAETRALAVSGRTLSLATSRGLAIIDKESRVISRYRTDVPVLDVAAGPRVDDRADVVLLNQDQSVAIVDPEQRRLDAMWQVAPVQPVWPGQGAPVPEAVLANQLDARGWLVALAGRGVARYRFETQGSNVRRLRAWQTSALSQLNLLGAIATDRGVWLQTASDVLFADRETLSPIPPRRLERPLATWDASSDGTWAAGTAAGGSAFLFNAGAGAWTGGFFRNEDTGLTAESDVTTSQATRRGVWLGGKHGLVLYDLSARVLSNVLKSDIRALAAAGDGIVAATPDGLYRANGATTRIDDGAVSWVATSPDGGSAMWSRQKPPSTDAEVRYRRLDDQKAAPVTLFGKGGWKSFAQPPVILGVYPVDSARALFTTDRGTFFYNYVDRTYSDCSQSLFRIVRDGAPPQITTVDLKLFSNVEQQGNRVLSIADGNPQSIRVGAPKWESLDPLRRTHPVQLADTGDRVFGIGRNGELHLYSPGRDDYLVGESKVLLEQPPAGNDFAGDILQEVGGRYRMALVHQGAVVTYDSEQGMLSDESKRFAGDELTQVRLLPGGAPVYLTRSGVVVDREHNVLFGAGALPFSFDAVTAVSAGIEAGAVVIGGPSGYVGEYSQPKGAWRPVGDRSLTGGAVTSIDVRGASMLVGQSTGDFSYLMDGKWISLRGFRKVVAGRDRLFALDGSGIARLLPSTALPAKWVDQRYSSGQGMQAFLARSVFAWQRHSGSMVFVRNDGRIGEYTSATDSWRELPYQPYGEPLQVQLVAANLVIFYRSGQIVQFDANLTPTLVTSLPPDATGASVRGDAGVLRATYVQHGVLHAIEWRAATGSRIIVQRGARAPFAFTPSDVVYAERSGRDVRLVDVRGNVVDYAPATGAWRAVRGAGVGETLAGWMPSTNQPIATLVVQLASSGMALVKLADGSSTPVAQLPANAATPHPGTLFDGNELRVIRDDQTHVFYHERELTSEPGGFVEETFVDAAIDTRGSVVALRRGALVVFQIRSNGLVADGAESAISPPIVSIAAANGATKARMNLSNIHVPDVFGTIGFGRRQLQFVPVAGGGVDARWRALEDDPPLPVWGSCGALAAQCVRDVAIDTGGALLVSTELALIVRDANTHQLIEAYPRLAHATFTQVRQPSHLYLSIAGGRRFEWLDQRPVASPSGADDFTTIVDVDAWRWVHRSSPGGLTIQSRSGVVRATTQVGPRDWKFQDDVVRWIHRAGSSLCVATQAGAWPADRQLRRSAERCDPGSDDRDEIDHPALRIAYRHGRVTLSPFDDAARAAIVRGRLFFDNGTQLAARGNQLYSLVPGRGLFERDSLHPQIVRRAWRVPAVAGEVTLESTGAALRLTGVDARGAQIEAYDLDLAHGTWNLAIEAPRTRKTTTSLVEWRADASRHSRFAPYAAIGQQRRIAGWWNGDRFGWDHVTGAALLSSNLVVAATASGPAVARIGAAQRLEWLAWLPDRPASRAATARENGRVVGVVVTGPDARELLFTEREGRVEATERGMTRSLLERATVTVGWVDQPPLGRRLDVVQSWDVTGGPAFRTSLPGLGGRFFRSGQFAFDGYGAATATGDAEWWIAPPCGGRSCVVTRNDVRAGRLILREVTAAPCAFSALRTGRDRSVLGVCAGSSRALWRLSGGGWTTVDDGAGREPFRTGDRIRFALRRLEWSIVGPRDPWSPGPFVMDTPGYPLFAEADGGFTVSFDSFTSIAFHGPSGHLAIGSRGGLWWWPMSMSRDNDATVKHRAAPTFGIPPRIESPKDWAVSRLRIDDAGRLWARLASGFVVEVGTNGALSANRAKTWPEAVTTASTYRVNLDSADVIGHDGMPIHESSDAWGLGRQPLTGIVGFQRDGQALWVATRKNGVVKFVLAGQR